MTLPKRVRSNKKLCYSGKKPMWEKDEKLWVYNPQFTEIETWQTYVDRWETMEWTDTLQVYDSLTPTEIWTLEDWVVATYTFKDYDNTVLKTGTVADGWTPVAPDDPTRAADAQYTYTFSWRDPAVWAIYKSTTYTAQYSTTTNQYTVSIASNDVDYWTVDVASVTVDYGTAISATNNVLTIGDTEITATAETWYEFSSWGTLPATVTETLSITATFVASENNG